MQDVERTLLSQYANSPTITTLIEAINQHLDPTANFDEFYRLVWNIDTAVGYGLDVWGRIVGVGRTISAPADTAHLGFAEGEDPDYTPFDEAPFYGGDPFTENYRLEDDAYRTLILIKAASNISGSTAPAINALLQQLFAARGKAYVTSLGDMRMRYTFEFFLRPYERAILSTEGVLPQPAGVEIEIVEISTDKTFGFVEAGDAAPFDEGTFYS